MIDLQELDKEIDVLLNNETKDSLTTWLLNKRYSNLTELLGKGSFVGLSNQGSAIFVEQKPASFNQASTYSNVENLNRQAA
jgi:hypothetical protein